MRNDRLIASTEFSSLHDPIELAIGPVDLVFKHSQRVRMEQMMVVSNHLETENGCSNL